MAWVTPSRSSAWPTPACLLGDRVAAAGRFGRPAVAEQVDPDDVIGPGQHRHHPIPPAGRAAQPVEQHQCRGIAGSVLAHVEVPAVQRQGRGPGGVGVLPVHHRRVAQQQPDDREQDGCGDDAAPSAAGALQVRGPGGRLPPAHQRPAHRDHGHRRDQQRPQDPHPGRLAHHQVDDFHQRDQLQPHGTVQHRVTRQRGQLRGRRRGTVAGGGQRRLQPRVAWADAGHGSGDGDRQHPDRGQDPAVGERPALSGHRQPGEDQQPHAGVGEAVFGQLVPGAQLADGAGAQQPGVGDQLDGHAAAEQHQPDQVAELQPGVQSHAETSFLWWSFSW
jgi:hypothetical protein